ncbi:MULTISPECIES: hypothetical protein [unclassified Halomicrobium]|uniref:hypothetical protein n=1 Tax=unclassified Halomicrobium TaxID=2610901 RepID=UPI0012A9A5EB|nr:MULTISPECIES: hypothetical protein [unclassified Halomicrobium]MBO4246634.1 hypothetical protein [Halomicrobium sp. IBSBa]QGA83207.1 hypothetical protein LC1Hm_2171 [Halomicrobium sp. LC1Hm]
MVATNAAVALILTTIVALALLTLATVYYVPKVLPGNDEHGEGDDEGNERPPGGHAA